MAAGTGNREGSAVGPLMLAAKRSRAHAGLLAAIGFVTAVIVALLVGLSAFLGTASESGIRSTLENAPPTGSSILIETNLSDESEAQTAAANAQFETVFGDLPVTVDRTVQSSAVGVSRSGEPLGAVQVLLRVDPQLEEHAGLVDGDWAQNPGTGGQATMQADAAARLGIVVGDVIALAQSPEPVTVVGTWRPIDATDPYWFAEPGILSGADGDVAGPLVLGEDELAALDVPATVRWQVAPDTSAVDAEDIAAISAALPRLEARVADDETVTVDSTTVRGTLTATLQVISDRLATVTAITAVPIALVATLGLVAVWQLVRLLAAARTADTRLLRSRGFSARQLASLTVVEALLIALPGAVIGAAGGSLLLALIAGDAAASAVASLWPVALAVALAVAIASLLAVRRSEQEARDVGAARRALAVTSGATAIAVIAAAVSLWQLRLYGAREGGGPVDPIAVVAPTAMLLALGLLGILLLFPILRAVDRLAAVRPGMLPVFPVRQVARRLPIYGLVVLLVTLAVGGATFAAGYENGWRTLDDRASALRTGADVRVAIDVPDSIRDEQSFVSGAPYSALTGVQAAAPVLATEATVGNDAIPFIAVRAAAVPGLMAFPGGEADAVALADALAAEPTGTPLEGRVDVTLTVEAPTADREGTVEVFLWMADEDGALTRFPLGTTTIGDARETVTFAEGPPAGVWRILAAEASLAGSDGAENVAVTLAGNSLPAPLELTLSWRDPTRRAMVGGDAEVKDLAVVVTEGTAARFAATVGDRLSLRLARSGASVEAVIVGTTAVLPGTSGSQGISADLPSLDDYLLRTSERIPQPGDVWLRTDQPEAVTASVGALSNHTSLVTSRATESSALLLEPVLAVLWWGMAGALLLAAVGFAAMTATLAVAGRDDVAVLRAFGMRQKDQARSRFSELGAILGTAVVLGLGAGILVSAGTVEVLSRAAVGATPGSVPVGFGFALPPLVALLAGFLVVAIGIAALSARRVHAHARRGIRAEFR